jgi:hypothetical protein
MCSLSLWGREDLERKVGVPHGLTITINLQEKKRKVGVPHGLSITINLQEKKRLHFLASIQ